MVIKKKNMSKSNWSRIIERQYAECNLEEKGIQGKAGLIKILKLKSELIKSYSGSDVIIADKNYYWLQIGIENKNYWITAIFDENKNFIQYYIDITLENNVINEEEPYFLDLFLDVVFLNNGKIVLLDEDELQIALEENIITKEQFEFAYKVANEIMEQLPNEKEKLDKLANKYLEKLIHKLKG